MDEENRAGRDIDETRVLQNWYNGYLEADDVSIYCQPLADVVLDEKLIEQQISNASKCIEIADGFCCVCQTVFDTWPYGMRHPGESQETDSGLEIEPLPHFGKCLAWRWHPGGGDVVTLNTRPDTISLEASARAGCRSCAFLFQSIVAQGLLHLFRVIEKRLDMLKKPSRVSLMVSKWSDQLWAYFGWYGFPGKCDHEWDTPYQELPPHALKFNIYRQKSLTNDESNLGAALKSLQVRNVKFPVPLDRVLSYVKQWASTCLSSHTECNSNPVAEYPSRLLSIAERPIKLVITTGWVSKPRYATLSYCWGGSGHLHLTHGNLERFTIAIPDALIPQTFEDAICLAKEVGLEYLWIDSLCISQDDLHDWESEASKMASIYGGSDLTIAASSAKNPSEGCFTRNPYGCGGFYTNVTVDDRTEILQFKESNLYKKHVTGSHLATRAWAVQEKILSLRTLHCGVWGYFWECRECVASESFPDGFMAESVPWPLVRHFSELKEPWHSDDTSRWAYIRDWYSGCDLTVPSDKLVAFSGIARVIQQQSGDEYAAGLWKNKMPADLCWVSEQPRKRPAYRAPTWSWASIDGKVSTRHTQPFETIYAVVETINLKHRNDTFGAVVGGSLSLRCQGLVAGRVLSKASARRNRPHASWIESGKYEVYVDLGHAQYDFAFDPDCWDVDDDEIHVDEMVYFLALHGGEAGTTSSRADGAEIKNKMIVGLVLQSTGKQFGDFIRVGYFTHQYRIESWHSDDVVDDYHPFLDLLETRGIEATRNVATEIATGADVEQAKFLIRIL